MEAIQEDLRNDSEEKSKEDLDKSDNQQQWWNEAEENFKDSNQ